MDLNESSKNDVDPLKGYRPTPLYHVIRFSYLMLLKIVWRLEIVNQENVPEQGGAIIAPNHMSYLDPPIMVSVFFGKRIVYSVGKEQLLDSKLFKLIHRHISMIPIKRGATDVEALKVALAVVKGGDALLMFPEGTRSRDGVIRKPKAGAAMISCLSGAPIIPVRIFNTHYIFKFAKIRIVYGKPIFPPKDYKKEDYHILIGKVMQEISKLK